MQTKPTPKKSRGRGRPPGSEKLVSPTTEGQRQLLEIEGTEAELATRLGCGNAVVGHWRRGNRLPGEAARHKLELLFGIPRVAWDASPGAATRPDASTDSVRSTEKKAFPRLKIAQSQIAEILKTLGQGALTDAAAAKLRDTLAKLMALEARLQRDQELLEDRIVREHPEWARTRAAILRALKPHPEAAKAVAEALQALETGRKV